MAFIDENSKMMYLCSVLVVTTLIALVKFLFFALSQFYLVRKKIYLVIQELCRPVPAGKDANYDAEFEKDFDTHLVNLLRYVERNSDSNARLDAVDAEAGRYIRFHNYLMVARFCIVILLLLVLAGILMHHHYSAFLTKFWSSIRQRA